MQHNFKRRISGAWQRFALNFNQSSIEEFLPQLRELFRFRFQFSKQTLRVLLVVIAAIATPITLVGNIFGYMRGYNKFMRPNEEWPRMYQLPPIVRWSMVIFGILVWVILIISVYILVAVAGPQVLQLTSTILYYVGINLALSIPIFLMFRRWRKSVRSYMLQRNKEGSARTADPVLLKEYFGKKGFYIGGGMTYTEKGHLLTVASSRSGKTENILAQNLLGVGGYDGSYVVTDPKGELAAITSKRLRQMGKKVVLLNPWNLLKEHIEGNDSYNPFDLVDDKTSAHLIDDLQLLAELICPIKPGDSNEFFTSSARNLISSLLLHIAVTQEGEKRSLATLWEWCRKSGKEMDEMLADMATSKDSVNGKALRSAANEIVSMMASPETFASIMATVFDSTNFLKSSALQDNLNSGFDPYSLTDGNTVVYIIIPVDKISSHSRWLRLVVTTLMRAVVRKPNAQTRTCFLCDEAASLGYVSEFETCLASYAGYGVTLWPIYQDLNQIKALYGEKWETTIANTSVKMLFGVRDNFTAEYIADAAGSTTNIVYKMDWMGTISGIETNHRQLFTPDEVKRNSKDNMFIFIGEHPVALVPKFPYYLMSALKNADGTNKYAPNPYILNSL